MLSSPLFSSSSSTKSGQTLDLSVLSVPQHVAPSRSGRSLHSHPHRQGSRSTSSSPVRNASPPSGVNAQNAACASASESDASSGHGGTNPRHDRAMRRLRRWREERLREDPQTARSIEDAARQATYAMSTIGGSSRAASPASFAFASSDRSASPSIGYRPTLPPHVDVEESSRPELRQSSGVFSSWLSTKGSPNLPGSAAESKLPSKEHLPVLPGHVDVEESSGSVNKDTPPATALSGLGEPDTAFGGKSANGEGHQHSPEMTFSSLQQVDTVPVPEIAAEYSTTAGLNLGQERGAPVGAETNRSAFINSTFPLKLPSILGLGVGSSPHHVASVPTFIPDCPREPKESSNDNGSKDQDGIRSMAKDIRELKESLAMTKTFNVRLMDLVESSMRTTPELLKHFAHALEVTNATNQGLVELLKRDTSLQEPVSSRDVAPNEDSDIRPEPKSLRGVAPAKDTDIRPQHYSVDRDPAQTWNACAACQGGVCSPGIHFGGDTTKSANGSPPAPVSDADSDIRHQMYENCSDPTLRRFMMDDPRIYLDTRKADAAPANNPGSPHIRPSGMGPPSPAVAGDSGVADDIDKQRSEFLEKMDQVSNRLQNALKMEELSRKHLESCKNTVPELRKKIEEKDEEICEKNIELARKHAEICNKDAEIKRLKGALRITRDMQIHVGRDKHAPAVRFADLENASRLTSRPSRFDRPPPPPPPPREKHLNWRRFLDSDDSYSADSLPFGAGASRVRTRPSGGRDTSCRVWVNDRHSLDTDYST